MTSALSIAYIDPASGMLLFQAMAAGLVGFIAFFGRSIWRIMTGLIRRRDVE